ncbi:hypothetical protein, partial [Streptomyces indicus]|uniref:hypothetical protein n=1 Tax=Streptomyces indicus TaxID=417292 RepID=UPI001C409300
CVPVIGFPSALSGTVRRNKPTVLSVLADVPSQWDGLFQRNRVLSNENERDGVVNLALTFGTLLSSQGTDASFVLTLSGFPPGFPSVFPTLSDSFGPDFLGAFQGFRFSAVSLSGETDFIRVSRPV